MADAVAAGVRGADQFFCADTIRWKVKRMRNARNSGAARER
jgi:hypothetical protein